ncbi:MAG: gliding motility-associated C-terminal domain-containing protein, partial [Weeksellaceae bacterium]|nr:gliding motility-associated C-terminal domain-containing protein [Weeksellaceae bacterium]
MCKNLYYSLLSLLLYTISFGQEVTLYEQFLGKYDFTMIGNTHNIVPNGSGGPCNILTTSSASLNLNPDQEIAAAYLYWAGSGSVAQFDYDIRLNGVNISPERTFTTDIAGRPVSGGFTDITAQVIA